VARRSVRASRTHNQLQDVEGVGARAAPSTRHLSLRCEYQLQGLEPSARLPISQFHVTARIRDGPGSEQGFRVAENSGTDPIFGSRTATLVRR